MSKAELTDGHVSKSLKNKKAYIANVKGEGYVLMPGNLPLQLIHHLQAVEAPDNKRYFDATLQRKNSPLHGVLTIDGDASRVEELRQRFSDPDRPLPLFRDGMEVTVDDLKTHEQFLRGTGARGAAENS